MLRALVLTLCLLLFASGCSEDDDPNVDPDQVDSVDMPETGVCRNLTPEEVSQPSNASKLVDCNDEHTAETFAVGLLPVASRTSTTTTRTSAGSCSRRCGKAYQTFLGADESLVDAHRCQLGVVPPVGEGVGGKGARWYRCDVVGGGTGAASYAPCRAPRRAASAAGPTRTGRCARGRHGGRLREDPCSEKHDWRAVTTIKLGQAKEPYPGDRIGEIADRQYCSDSVGAWLNYPATTYEYEYGVPRGGVEGWQPPVDLLGEDRTSDTTYDGRAARRLR